MMRFDTSAPAAWPAGCGRSRSSRWYPARFGSPRPAVTSRPLMAPSIVGRALRCVHFGWLGRRARPHQPECHQGGEEGANEASWAIPRHLDFRIAGLLAQLRLLARALLYGPVGLLALDAREHREVEAWWR